MKRKRLCRAHSLEQPRSVIGLRAAPADRSCPGSRRLGGCPAAGPGGFLAFPGSPEMRQYG